MNENKITVYIHDLNISLKAKGILTRAGLIKLSDLIAADFDALAKTRGVTNDVLHELRAVIAHSDEIADFFEARAKRITEILPSIQNIPIENLGLKPRSCNSLKKAGVDNIGSFIQMSRKDIFELQNVGTPSREEITKAIEDIIRLGKAYFEKPAGERIDASGNPAGKGQTEKGFDYSVIDVLTRSFGLKPVNMAEWFGLSRQSIYNALEKRAPAKKLEWTGKTISEREINILSGLIESNKFDYKDDEAACCCMNNKQDDFVCIFIYKDTIKCFFLKDLPDILQTEIIRKKMHKYTKRELAGESDGKIVNVFTKPFYKPNNPELFRANAQLRSMTPDEYAVFLSGCPCINQNSVTDDQIIAFMNDNLVDGKVYISSDPKNQWIRSIASRHGYTIKELIELYGYEPQSDRSKAVSDKANEQYREQLKQYVVHDNTVYLPVDSREYKLIYTYAYKLGTDINSYIRMLGFERTTERPDSIDDMLEKDMEVRHSDGAYEDKIFATYPLVGSKILRREVTDKLNANARKYINAVLQNPQAKLPLKAEMQITLALINNAKSWKNENNSNFWNYISLRFGYRDASGSVVKLLKSSLENAMKRNHRLFLEDANGRAFKSTALIHALSTRKSWMALFDFLFDFYKRNLNWRVIPDDPLITVMIHALQQKLSGDNDDDSELTISSKVYSFQEGIRKLILYRPVYTCKLFEKLIRRIDSLINSDVKPVKTYEEQLCEEWFKEKITAIASTKKEQRQYKAVQRDVAIDYSRIRVKYLLKNESDVQIVIPDIRLKNEDIEQAVLLVSCDGTVIIRQKLSWYGNELGKTLNGVSVSVPFIPQTDGGIDLQVQIICDEETIYDSEETMNRGILLFNGATETAPSQIKRERYTLIVPNTAVVETENVDAAEIDSLKNSGLKAYFLELQDGYIITVNGRLLAFDSENGTEIRVITPKESTALPFVTLQETEACIAYRSSTCTIILGNTDYRHQFVLLKNGKKVEFSDLQQSNNGLAFMLPLSQEKDTLRLQIINLADERLLFDKTFMLIDNADCCFNREFYFSSEDYENAEYYVDIDDFRETVPFTKEDSEIRIPFRSGVLHAAIPKAEVRETSGTWMHEPRPAWFIGTIPQASFFKVITPENLNVIFMVNGKDIKYDGQGIVAIGNVLQSFSMADSSADADIVMCILGPTQKESYKLATVYFKEQFLKQPEFWFEEHKLFWDRGGVFIGNSGRQFSLTLTGPDEAEYEFNLNEDTECIAIPIEMPIGNYCYEISIMTGGLFKKAKETIAVGDCIIGDKNLLRFINRKIVVKYITDEFKEEAGHIPIRTCYIDQIKFRGIEDTSEGLCPIYEGTLFTIGYNGERYEFSFDEYTNKKGKKKMIVNPVRIVYISDTALCITDADGDGLYYYSYYDRNTESTIYALTDYEYTKVNKHKYSNADLYLYRTERM